MFNNWLPLTRVKIFCARILYKATVLFTGKGKRIVVRDGVRYEIDPSEGIDLSLYLFGNFQKNVTENSFLAIKDDFLVIDIGANIGAMTLKFAQQVPHGRVYAFEPAFYALEKLQRNLSLNEALAQRITVINSFVSEKSSSNPDIVAFSSWKVDGGERGSDVHPMHLGTPKSTEGVPAISLDDFAEAYDLARLDFIKVDTDGHEYEVFKGGKKAIAKYKPKIVFEIGLYVMEEKHFTFDFYFNYFNELGYKLIDTKTNVEITLENYRKFIPKNGTTDLIAVPR